MFENELCIMMVKGTNSVLWNYIVRDFEIMLVNMYGRQIVKMKLYCLSNFSRKKVGCYLNVVASEGKLNESKRTLCAHTFTSLFCYREMNSVTRIEKFLEKPYIGEVGYDAV